VSHFDEMKAAASEAQEILSGLQGDDGRFTLGDDDEVIYYGTASNETNDQTLLVGGRMINLAKIIVATVDQFSGDPTIGALVQHAGTTYKLVKREKDGLHYILYLDAPDK